MFWYGRIHHTKFTKEKRKHENELDWLGWIHEIPSPCPPRKPSVCSANGEPEGSPRPHENRENQRNARKGGQGDERELFCFQKRTLDISFLI